MLLELRAENYAVIDQAVASFGPGLNLLTGETGAGKSILIDALELLLGGKASSDVVRHGAERAVLGCVFESTPVWTPMESMRARRRTLCCGARLPLAAKDACSSTISRRRWRCCASLRRSWA
jgi:DNA repair ATPase RecN